MKTPSSPLESPHGTPEISFAQRCEIVSQVDQTTIDDTLRTAIESFYYPGQRKSVLMDEAQCEEWTEYAKSWGARLPEGFLFNRALLLSTQPGVKRWVRPHRDHPDFQGEIDMMELQGSAEISVPHEISTTIRPGSLVRMAGWPLGRTYPQGVKHQRKFSGVEDLRTEHGLRYVGPRTALILSYDANPGNDKSRV